MGGRSQQGAKIAEDERANRIALVRSSHPSHKALIGGDVEVVEPEVHQHFLKLPLALRGPYQFCAHQLHLDLLRQLLPWYRVVCPVSLEASRSQAEHPGPLFWR